MNIAQKEEPDNSSNGPYVTHTRGGGKVPRKAWLLHRMSRYWKDEDAEWWFRVLWRPPHDVLTVGGEGAKRLTYEQVWAKGIPWTNG